MAEKTTELSIAGSKLEEVITLLQRISENGIAEQKDLADKAMAVVSEAKGIISDVYDIQMEEDDR